MTSLVLGVGYIGSALCRSLIESGERVVGFDNLFTTDTEVIRSLGSAQCYRFIEGSVTCAAEIEAAFALAEEQFDKVDTVYNLAAQSSANPEAASAEYTEETNLRGPRLVLDAAIRHGVKTVVFGSSLRYYGQSLERGMPDESAPAGVFSDLSHLSKIYVEKLHEMYANQSKPLGRVISARIGLVYGVAPVMKTDGRFLTAPNKFALMLTRGQTPSVWNDSKVALAHVEDVARALRSLAVNSDISGYHAVNVATEFTSVARIAEMAAALFRDESPTGPLPLPLRPTLLASSGFEPKWSLEDGLRGAIDHFRSLPNAAGSSGNRA